MCIGNIPKISHVCMQSGKIELLKKSKSAFYQQQDFIIRYNGQGPVYNHVLYCFIQIFFSLPKKANGNVRSWIVGWYIKVTLSLPLVHLFHINCGLHLTYILYSKTLKLKIDLKTPNCEIEIKGWPTESKSNMTVYLNIALCL